MTHEDAVGRHVAERYLLNELAAADRDAFEEHFFSCERCAEEVRAVHMFAANARAVFLEELDAQAAPAAKRPERPERPWATLRRWLESWAAGPRAVLVPVLTSALLLCLVGYQALLQVPALRAELARTQAPRALSTTVLRPATRGEGTIVILSAGDGFAHLSFDVNPEQPLPAYVCEVRTANGSEVFSLRVPAPPPGLPLNLLVPASLLTRDRYTLTVRAAPAGDAEAAGPVIDTFEFIVERR